MRRLSRVHGILEGDAMQKAVEYLRNGLAIIGLLALGYWLGSGSHGSIGQVQAASSSGAGVSFQIDGVSENSALLVYHPDSKSLYVYRGATVGSSVVQCAFKFQIGEPGEALRRTNCPVGSAQ
jgi:hypothetical protein